MGESSPKNVEAAQARGSLFLDLGYKLGDFNLFLGESHLFEGIGPQRKLAISRELCGIRKALGAVVEVHPLEDALTDMFREVLEDIEKSLLNTPIYAELRERLAHLQAQNRQISEGDLWAGDFDQGVDLIDFFLDVYPEYNLGKWDELDASCKRDFQNLMAYHKSLRAIRDISHQRFGGEALNKAIVELQDSIQGQGGTWLTVGLSLGFARWEIGEPDIQKVVNGVPTSFESFNDCLRDQVPRSQIDDLLFDAGKERASWRKDWEAAYERGFPWYKKAADSSSKALSYAISPINYEPIEPSWRTHLKEVAYCLFEKLVQWMKNDEGEEPAKEAILVIENDGKCVFRGQEVSLDDREKRAIPILKAIIQAGREEIESSRIAEHGVSCSAEQMKEYLSRFRTCLRNSVENIADEAEGEDVENWIRNTLAKSKGCDGGDFIFSTEVKEGEVVIR